MLFFQKWGNMDRGANPNNDRQGEIIDWLLICCLTSSQEEYISRIIRTKFLPFRNE
jgi:hypothetical protein